MKTFLIVLTSAAIAMIPKTARPETPSTNRVLSLDGNASYVSVPSSPLLENPTATTIEAWIYPLPPTSNTNHGWFVAKSDGLNASSQRSYELDWWSSGGSRIVADFFLGTTNWSEVGVSAPMSNWVYVAVSYSAASGLLMLYTNGVEVDAKTRDTSGVPLAGLPLRQTSQPLLFGGSSGAFSHGYLDEVRIWNVARTGYEILSDYRTKISGTSPNLAGCWTFDNGTATDQTANKFNGTFHGNATTVADDATAPANVAQAVEVYFGTGFASTFYQLQYLPSLTSTNWTNVGDPVCGNGNMQSVFDTTRHGTQRFYRVISY